MKNKSLLVGFYSKEVKMGPGESFNMLVEGFQEAGLDYDVVFIEGGLGQRQIVGKFSLLKMFRSFKTVVEVWIKLPSVRNVYLTNSLSKIGFIRDLLIIFPAYILRKRIVLHVKSGGYGDFYRAQTGFFKKLIERTISRATKIIVLGESLRNQFSFLTGNPGKVCVVYNGLPYPLFPAQIIHKEFVPGEKNIRILYLSNMIRSKGYLVLLEACKLLKDQNFRNFECNFCGNFVETVGEIPEGGNVDKETHFKDLISGWGLQDHVRYLGMVSGEDKIDILNNSELFVLPTNFPWEGQPVSIVEALAFGIPVISTNYRSIPEQVIDGYNGYLVDFDNPRQIAEKILLLANNPEIYREFSEHAREHFQANFSRESHLQKIIPIITGTER